VSRRINYTAMADDSRVVVDDDESSIVTEFLLDTCRLPLPTVCNVGAAMSCTPLATLPAPKSLVVDVTHRIPNSEHHHIPLTTGSSAEFYIRPMLSCVGDMDIMYHRSD